ncbi:hypothetical protein BO71DRAFT_428898 [Aspergillus ellipticus CBS 707.79]|uniref:Ketosynthase family 3 (KS3) domain-containing protein n=1 Tax=Aspergillus ellipticus CBS 707.79 TaxID=1448320 RepID=A0A319E4V5_9EURO|nr:hypothetical protein BO71DRAFT_428898 [Aspergillus ellipticus CBS 707.79]
MAIVGGSNLILNPQTSIALSNLGKESASPLTIELQATAVVMAFVPFYLNPSLTPIRAVIRETGVNQGGRTLTITTPSREAQEELIRACYSRAGLDPKDTGYVQAHGTGTITGDCIELDAIGTVFQENRHSEEPLCIGYIKANFDHLESSSGLAAIIKVVMMLEKGLIPPCANFESPNPSIDFRGLKLKIPTRLEKWPKDKLQRASISNFGYGKNQRSCHYRERSLLPKSAKDEKSLRRMIQNLEDYCVGPGAEQRPSDLSYTLTLRWSDYKWRAVASAQSIGDLKDALSDPKVNLAQESQNPRLGFVFTGQGAQWFAMGRELLTAYPQFMAAMQEAHDFLKDLGATWGLLGPTDEFNKDENATRINERCISFPLCVVLQICLFRLLYQWRIRPTAGTGHSSGDISAAYASGALSFKEAIVTAYYRGSLCSELVENSRTAGSMLALGKGRVEALQYIRHIRSGTVVVACVNSPSSVTGAGDIDAIDEVKSMAAADNVFSRRLKVRAAYHSPHMQPVANQYEAHLHQHLHHDGCFRGILFSSSATGGLLNSAQQLGPAY